MNILGLDLGTKTGCAVLNLNNPDEVVLCETWNLSGKKTESSGKKFYSFEEHLLSVVDTYSIIEISYEYVSRHIGTLAAHCYGGFEALLLKCAYAKNLNITKAPVKTVKLFATGKGSASKEQMIKAATDKWRLVPVDDNAADALWIAALLCDILNK